MSGDNMSTQASIEEFRTGLEIREEGGEGEKPSWAPEDYDKSGATRHCDQCGAAVSRDFVRVFADNDGVLRNGCPECATYREISGMDGDTP